MKSSMNADALWRRKNHRWEPAEIELLIDAGFLHFLPARFSKGGSRIRSAPRVSIVKPSKALTTKQIQSLDAVALDLQIQRLPASELDARIVEAATTIAPIDRGLAATSGALSYLRITLGSSLTGPERKVGNASGAANRDSHMSRLANCTQKDCVQQWTGIPNRIWMDFLWQECLRLRYDQLDPLAIRLLPPQWRQYLDKEAARLRREKGTHHISEQQIHEVSAGLDRSVHHGFAILLLGAEYLRSKVASRKTTKNLLDSPVSRCGLFEAVAAFSAQGSASVAERPEFIRSFCRYLTTPKDHPDELIGLLILKLIRIEADRWEGPPSDSGNQNTCWLPRLRIDYARPGEDWEFVTQRVSAALGVSEHFFAELRGVWNILSMREFWQGRTAEKHTAFWMAHILENEHSDVHRIYGRWIDMFHAEVLRPLMKHPRRNDPSVRTAALRPFSNVLDQNPALLALLHHEALDGADQVEETRGEKKLPFREPISILAACAVARLRDMKVRAPKVTVEEILPQSEIRSMQIRESLEAGKRGDKIGGYSLNSFLAPVLTAIVNNGPTVVTRHSVQDAYNHWKNSSELIEINSDLAGFMTRAGGTESAKSAP